jgi:hypothetical protein
VDFSVQLHYNKASLGFLGGSSLVGLDSQMVKTVNN